jgi:hypothetical protein
MVVMTAKRVSSYPLKLSHDIREVPAPVLHGKQNNPAPCGTGLLC